MYSLIILIAIYSLAAMLVTICFIKKYKKVTFAKVHPWMRWIDSLIIIFSCALFFSVGMPILMNEVIDKKEKKNKVAIKASKSMDLLTNKKRW